MKGWHAIVGWRLAALFLASAAMAAGQGDERPPTDLESQPPPLPPGFRFQVETPPPFLTHPEDGPGTIVPEKAGADDGDPVETRPHARRRTFGLRAQGFPFHRDRFQVNKDFELKAGEEAGDVVVVGGSARIHGAVRGDLTVVFGELALGSQSVVHGDVVVIGTARFAGTAAARGGVTVIGTMDAEPGFRPAGVLNVTLDVLPAAALDYIRRGLLYGRIGVPDLAWFWMAAGILLLFKLLVMLIAHRPVVACAGAVRERPLASLLFGLLLLALVPSAILLLAVSVFGLIAIPFALATLFVGFLFGNIGVYRAMGERIGMLAGLPVLASPLPALVTGTAILYTAYLIPVLGFLVFGFVQVLALGSPMEAIVRHYRQRRNGAPAASAGAPPVARPAGAGIWAGPACAVAPRPDAGTQRVRPVSPASPEIPPEVGREADALPVVARARPADAPEPIVITPAAPPAIGAWSQDSDASAGPGSPRMPSGPPANAMMPEPPRGVGTPPVAVAGLPRAGLGIRIGAGLLDAVLLAILLCVGVPLWLHVQDAFLPFQLRFNDQIVYLFAPLILVAYHAVLWTLRGTTVGGSVVGMKVVRADGHPLRFAEALVRALGSLLSLAVFGLGFFWIAFDPQKQAWHDRIAGTYVVLVPKGVPLV
jgi:uncharacterized RDD family membrane protein YckC